MSYLLGIDAGLTNTKAAVFDDAGTEVAVAVRRPENVTPAPDQVERDLDVLWDAVTACVREAVAAAPVDADAIGGVGVTAHGHGLYLLDEGGDPVRNGIKSTDSRAADVVAGWREDGRAEAMADITGYEPFVADPLSLLAWLKRHEPAAYDRIDTVFFCKDYLKYRLTGAVSTDEMEASVFEDVDEGGYSRDLFEVLDLPEVADALPDVVPSWEIAGEVTAEAAAETGLAEGTPVASGLHDVGATALGSGVHEPGQAMLIVGTWGQSIVVRDAPRTDRETAGITRRYLDGGYLSYKGNRSAATCLDWFVDEFGAEWRREAEDRGVSPYAVYDETVADVPVGAEGVLFHPYLHGSTDNPNARAGFYGLGEAHGKEHMLRAVYEGVAVTQCERLRELADGVAGLDVRIAGGGAKSPVWTQLFADVLGETVRVPDGDELGARGAAICAGVATGVYPDHETAVAETVTVARAHDADPEAVASYRRVRDAFETARAAMQSTWEQLRTEQSTD